MVQNPMKRFINHNLGRFGFEIRQTGHGRSVMDFMANRAVDVVLDVGANVGQFGSSLRAQGYRGKIVSFEPIRSVYQTLAAMAAADGNWEAHNFALGTEAGRTTINVSDASVFSSILPSAPAAALYDTSASVSHTETIEVQTLDTVMPTTKRNTLLKIDTQGYERQVLEGGRQALKMMQGVLTELPIIHLYERTWQLHEAIEFMAAAGFVPAQIHPVNYHSIDKVSLVEVDCLFRPRDGRVD